MIGRPTTLVALVAATLIPTTAQAAVTPDGSYGTGGTASLPSGCSSGTTGNVATAAGFNGGFYVLAECAHGYDRLTALTNDGQVDTSYGTDGHLVIKFSPPCWGSSVRLRPTEVGTGRGQLFIASEGRGSDGGMHVCIVRVTTAGKLYPTYGGKTTVSGFSLSTPYRHLDRVGGGTNRLVDLVAAASGKIQVFSERINADWRTAAAFVNDYASNGDPNPNFSGDGQRAFIQPYSRGVVWGGGGTIAIKVDNGRGLEGTQVIAYDNHGDLDTDFAGDGSRFLSRTALGDADVVPDQVVGDVTASGRALVFATHHSSPGKQWIDLDLIGPTGRLRSSFDNATQKISALSASDLGGIRLQISDDHYVVDWDADNLPHSTGFNPDGTRWAALGPTGTAKVQLTVWAVDQPAFYTVTTAAGPTTTVNIKRSTVD